MSNTLILKPNKGLKVRKPDGKPLAKDGEQVVRSAFWLRRLKDNDVVALKELPKPPATSIKSKESK
ncbi:DUF2635 domain-containing protein [Vibrio sp. LaRot3]|uniref:DUF2635 domain-containing protein n=1 Tax=Vibrio sp. LaRot3 TaxID=2998829 RepID=UPI0022CE109B|nr:DUF2635 domain-containing protein [Vibrio sp. LaRot3]MDA0148854.1 DUF2635 domain-containing protein [Vibrio sp. LaRot3]